MEDDKRYPWSYTDDLVRSCDEPMPPAWEAAFIVLLFVIVGFAAFYDAV